MRRFPPTAVFAAVSLALCAPAAFAQVNAGRATAGPGATSPAARSGVSTSTSSTGNNITFSNPNATTNTGQSNQSGSTGSMVTTIVGTQGGFTTFNVPAAVNGNGTNPNPNFSQGQTSGAAANGSTGSTLGQTSGTGNGQTSQGVTPSSIANLQGAQLVDTQGRVFTDANGNPLSLDARGVVGIAPGGFGNGAGIVTGTPEASGGGQPQVMVLNAANSAGSVTLTPELDRATRKELNKAKVASRSRNKQLLYTIAPRTHVDRSGEVPDDPISPALSTPDRGFPRY